MDAAGSDASPDPAPPAPPSTPTNGAEMLPRRRFFSRLSTAVSAAAAVIVGVPFIGFLVAPLVRRVPREWRAVGPVDRFAVGETVSVTFQDASPLPWSGVTARTAAWLRRTEDGGFTAFSVNCTHLGCPVQWIADARLFLCPCHGGVYNADGTVAAGPPPRPLGEYPVRVRSGRVEILTSPIPFA
ncbi:MAG TPA: Rieske (2Fe-2S) protein [Gemmatimonadales bacterium]|nr:Rieske (2Fe-2S) protein [Gemmatimonadales bacterium]